eukprot:m.177800 g.177800  ORF g.177800 m.177800 type:complete len:481 (+) comp14636_c0_seq1:76-1518(+)
MNVKLVFVCLLASMVTMATAKKELLLTQIVFRHGDRSSTRTVEALGEVQWPDGLGQLTPTGMQMHFNLGRYFRNHYLDLFQTDDGWSGDYHRDLFRVRSTDIDRTLMSAQSQLAGWFPTNTSIFAQSASLNWRPVPVHTVAFANDSLLVPFDIECPLYEQLVESHRTSDAWKQKMLEVAPELACKSLGLQKSCTAGDFLAAASKKVNIELDLRNIWILSDDAFCRAQSNKTLPDWISPSNEQGKETFVYLRHLEDWAMYELFNGTTERRLSGGPLLNEMIGQMYSRLSDQTKFRVLLYSAHDTTVAALLEALNTNHWRAHQPPYASAVLVELYREEANPSPQYFVQVTYKNESAVTAWNHTGHVLLVPGCNTTMCPLQRFADVVYDVLPTDWNLECLKTQGAVQKEKYVVAFIVTMIAIVLISVGACQVIKARKRNAVAYKRTGLDASLAAFAVDDEDEEDIVTSSSRPTTSSRRNASNV